MRRYLRQLNITKGLLALMLVSAQPALAQDTLGIALKKEISEMYTADQRCREMLRSFKNTVVSNTDSLYKLEKQVRTVDSLHYFKLRKFVDLHGFPGYDLVGKDFSDSFWNLVQHQDDYPAFQEEVLRKMWLEVSRNNATGIYYAYLLDRVKVNAGALQVYGTQMRLSADSTSFEPQPAIDPQNLDRRRAEVGLPPMREYIDQMNARNSGSLRKEE